MASIENFPDQAGRTARLVREIAAPRENVFDALIRPEDLVHWCHAGDGWTTPYAETDVRPGGALRIGYRSPDGAEEFAVEGTYRVVSRPDRLEYVLSDGRPVIVTLEDLDGRTRLTEEFGLETENSEEMQRAGWSEHLDNLATYLERQST